MHMFRVFLNRITLIFLIIFTCTICISCKGERVIYRNIYCEYDENLMKYGIDSSSMFKSSDISHKIDYDSLQNVISEVYSMTRRLIDDKTLDGDINNLYLKIKKDSVWLVYASFIPPQGHVRIGGDVGYRVSNDGKILSIIIGE